MTDPIERVALVTGGTSGIGEASVRALTDAGVRVAFTGRDEAAGRAIEADLGDRGMFIYADALELNDIRGSVRSAGERWGRLDILFNNAGAPVLGGPQDFEPGQFQKAMDLLLRSALLYVKHSTPFMIENGWGRIINNSSVAALRSDLGGYLYSIAKAGLTHATRLMARELGAKGITANAISPGAIATPVFYGGSSVARAADVGRETARAAKLERNLMRATPVGRTGRPTDVANVVVFLASEGAGFVNGVDIAVDGGMTVGGRSDYGA